MTSDLAALNLMAYRNSLKFMTRAHVQVSTNWSANPQFASVINKKVVIFKRVIHSASSMIGVRSNQTPLKLVNKSVLLCRANPVPTPYLSVAQIAQV